MSIMIQRSSTTVADKGCNRRAVFQCELLNRITDVLTPFSTKQEGVSAFCEPGGVRHEWIKVPDLLEGT